MIPPPPTSTLFPYTTLFRSGAERRFAEPARPVARSRRRRRRTHATNRARGVRSHGEQPLRRQDRKSTRLNSSHVAISYAVFCLKKKKKNKHNTIHNVQAKTK